MKEYEVSLAETRRRTVRVFAKTRADARRQALTLCAEVDRRGMYHEDAVAITDWSAGTPQVEDCEELREIDAATGAIR